MEATFFQLLLENIWRLTQQMAPYLLLGFALAGVVSQLMPQAWIKAHLASGGVRGVLKAVIIGLPLPVCSCGVIPLAASLRRQGASKGAIVAFTTTTPQVGIDSLVVSYYLMGGIFTLARVMADLFSGIVAGISVTRFAHELVGGDTHEIQEQAGLCCEQAAEATSRPRMLITKTRAALKEGFIALPEYIGKSIIMGIIVAGGMTTLFPESALEHLNGHFLFVFAMVTLVATPLYVCSTGSIPLALAFIQSGLSPGAALVFLITGPATNAATVTTLFRIIGKRETFVYLSVLIVSAWSVGFCFDRLVQREVVLPQMYRMEESLTPFHTVCAIVLVGLLVWASITRRKSGVGSQNKSEC